jgi:hypothetical protein
MPRRRSRGCRRPVRFGSPGPCSGVTAGALVLVFVCWQMWLSRTRKQAGFLAAGIAIASLGSFRRLTRRVRTPPRWPGFLTRGSMRAQSLPGQRGPVTATRPRGPGERAPRLQWRDRVGFAPTSRGRRGERRCMRSTSGPAARGRNPGSRFAKQTKREYNIVICTTPDRAIGSSPITGERVRCGSAKAGLLPTSVCR